MMIWSTYGSYPRLTRSRWSMQAKCTKSNTFAFVVLVDLSAPDKLKLRYKERLSNTPDPIKRTGTSVQEVDLEVDPTGPPVHFANQIN